MNGIFMRIDLFRNLSFDTFYYAPLELRRTLGMILRYDFLRKSLRMSGERDGGLLSFKRSLIYMFCIWALPCSASVDHHPPVPQPADERAYGAERAPISGYSAVTIDPRRVQLLGVTTAPITTRDLTTTIRTVGIVDVDETRIANIQTKFTGWIEQLYVNFVGKPVAKGEALFQVYSPELLAAQEEYVVALKDAQSSHAGKFSQEFKSASQELVQAAAERLKLWDISPSQIEAIKQCQCTQKTMVIRSPRAGIVIRKTAFVGMNVGPGIQTYTIADLSHVWVLADIYEDDVSLIRIGQPATLTVPALSGTVFHGTVTFIDYVVGTSTRTTKVRFEFDNAAYHLKPGMFATVEIKRAMGRVLALPEEALIDTGERKIVFIALPEGRFEPREVKVGFKAGGFYQIVAGLKEDEVVVTSSQFLLDSESRLKAFGQPADSTSKTKTSGE